MRKSDKKLFEKPIKEVPVIKIILISILIGVLGFILGFTIIRLVFRSIAWLILLFATGTLIYLIIKYTKVI